MTTLAVGHFPLLFTVDQWWGAGMVICQDEVQIFIWPTDATATHYLLFQKV